MTGHTHPNQVLSDLGWVSEFVKVGIWAAPISSFNHLRSPLSERVFKILPTFEHDSFGR